MTRDAGWGAVQEPVGEPIIVATRNDDLSAVVARIPAHRRDDLVFVQNGMLRPWLASNQLAKATRGILRFAVPTRTSAAQVGDDSLFTGPLASLVVAWLNRMHLDAREVRADEFAQLELEKLVWNCAMGVLGDALEANVGQLVTTHADSTTALCRELLEFGSDQLGVAINVDAAILSIVAYSKSIADYRAAVREFDWRNGWFVQLSQQSGLQLQLHEFWLARAKKPS